MWHFRSWMLIGALGFLASCQTPIHTAPSTWAEVPETMTIDFEKGEARTSVWTKQVINCSDDRYNCVIVEGLFGASFPKKCADFSTSAAWSSIAGKIRNVAPELHFGLPFGSYISDSYPRALLFYRGGIGLDELRIVNVAPFQSNFDPNSFSVSYRISYMGKPGLFLCK